MFTGAKNNLGEVCFSIYYDSQWRTLFAREKLTASTRWLDAY
jgi:hypothetical protein